uniref:NADH-ubiquinone oxidoreductase chain 3 n=1 Tax=Pyrearinus termitilluminans TaxID=109589 RepID=A0A161ANY4_9COLE|nr:NADH dehydrogenase subunit 3 [Pyrearinus termitilluminans]AIQ80128.1 NADH dehydrogenase subunit 3 [Pyrearinus termitilluminans]
MMIVTSISSIMLLISTAMIIMASLISKKTFSDREKSSPFECGFDPKSSARIPFSLQFFLIAVIFLIFDVEITLILPLIVTMKISNTLSFLSITTTFIIILLSGLYHEWSQGALNWAY